MKHVLINGDCLEVLMRTKREWDTAFVDPPDNLGVAYPSYNDHRLPQEYLSWIDVCLRVFLRKSRTLWLSCNSRWIFPISRIVEEILRGNSRLEAKFCVQVFTFGQHNHHDLGNNNRPLIRIKYKDVPLYAGNIRVPSWRQEHGDKRANPEGRVPGDVFDFTRVTGNSKQRRKWCPTQLNEGLVERCLKLTTPEGGTVLDPFAGSGTTFRVCDQLGFSSTSIEIDPLFCSKIAEEHGLTEVRKNLWRK